MNLKEVYSMYDSLIKDSNKQDNVSCDFLLELFSEYNGDFHALDEIEKAYNFAFEQHKEQKRDSGEAYIVHPLSVAIILANMHADKDTICAGLLHDVIEDTGTTELNLAMLFNSQIAHYVAGVSNLEEKDDVRHKLDDLAYIRKLLITGTQDDLEIILIKLADKLHNMRTLEHKRAEKQVSTAKETLELFAPLAGRIGVYQVKNELEDLSLKFIRSDCYNFIKQVLVEELIKRKQNVYKAIQDIDLCLNAMDIDHKFKCSAKNIYGIYLGIEDMLPCENVTINDVRKALNEKNIHDLISVQVLVSDVKTCYEADRLINSYYSVVKEETKDYIKNPKSNMYRSLHTTVCDDENKLIQIQIRTPNMDKVADYGFSACWDLSGPYAKTDMKEGIKRNIKKPVHAIDRIYASNEEFLTHIKSEMLQEDNIVVYTPTREAIELPAGATPIDFAYQIHTEIGNNLDYAIINGQKKDVYQQLHDGDVVKAVVSKNTHPNLLWLEHIVTTRAYKKICEYVRIDEPKDKVLTKKM